MMALESKILLLWPRLIGGGLRQLSELCAYEAAGGKVTAEGVISSATY
jgi:hypothetical protein